MWELLTWSLPWGAQNPWGIVSTIISGGRLPIPPVEDLPGPGAAEFAGLEEYMALMNRCWAQDPRNRPGFKEIINDLRALREKT
jgi:hypothetical protein